MSRTDTIVGDGTRYYLHSGALWQHGARAQLPRVRRLPAARSLVRLDPAARGNGPV